MPRFRHFHLCAIFVVLCMIFGGGTRQGLLGDAILQLAAIPLLISSLLHWRAQEVTGHFLRIPVFLIVGAVLLAAIQLFPLPPIVWTWLPGRDLSTSSLDLLNEVLPWAPLSLSPNATVMAALTLLPPVAIFFGTLRLSNSEKQNISLVLLGVGLLGALLGLLQAVQGPNSTLSFLSSDLSGEAVGFFANRNHFAAFLYALLVLAAAWAIDVTSRATKEPVARNFTTHKFVVMGFSLVVLVLLLAAQIMARSRAGVMLTIVGLLGILVMVFGSRGHAGGRSSARLIASAFALVLVFSTQFALLRLMDRFAADPLADARFAFAHNTIEAVKAAMPFGTGIGSFIPTYAHFEAKVDTILGVYANHAHNEYLELGLETGVFGAALVAVFLIWFIARTRDAWVRPREDTTDFELLLMRSATIIIGLLLAHSIVDYPLRTQSLMVVFALSCALLVPCINQPQQPTERRSGQPQPVRANIKKTPARHAPRDAPQTPPLETLNRPTPQSPPQPTRWGTEIEWPSAWKSDPLNDKRPTGKSSPQKPVVPDEE